MRITVSGEHHTGKTALIGELAGRLPTFSTVDEPYYLLQDEAHSFAELPCLEDIELQFERSIKVRRTRDNERSGSRRRR
jgi:hypothetical protein